MQKLLPYLQLMRLPAVFTAMGDIVLGYLLTHASPEPVAERPSRSNVARCMRSAAGKIALTSGYDSPASGSTSTTSPARAASAACMTNPRPG